MKSLLLIVFLSFAACLPNASASEINDTILYPDSWEWFYSLDSAHKKTCLALLSQHLSKYPNLKFSFMSYRQTEGWGGTDGFVPMIYPHLAPEPVARVITAGPVSRNFVESEIARGAEAFARVSEKHSELRRATLLKMGATEAEIDELEAVEKQIPKEAISFISVTDTKTGKVLGVLRVVSLKLFDDTPPPLPFVIYLQGKKIMTAEVWRDILKKAYGDNTPQSRSPLGAIELGMLYIDGNDDPALHRAIWNISFDWLTKVQPWFQSPYEENGSHHVIFGHAIAPRTQALYQSPRYGKMNEVFHLEQKDAATGANEYHSILTKPAEDFLAAVKKQVDKAADR
jgi:hypothetical protein